MDDSSEKDERLDAPEVREVLRTLEQAGLENMSPVWDDGRMIMEESHMREGTGRSRSVVRGSDGTQEKGSNDTFTPVSGYSRRQEKWYGAGSI